MPALVGRSALIEAVGRELDRGRSVLLVGPAGAGKSALIDVVARPGVLIVDPFERLSAHRAAFLRRWLDRAGAILGAARGLDRRTLGCAGRLLGRFVLVRVHPLPRRDLMRIVTDVLAAEGISSSAVPRHWCSAAAHAARGLPGHAVAMAAAAARRRRETGAWLPPALALTEALTAELCAGQSVTCAGRVSRQADGLDRGRGRRPA